MSHAHDCPTCGGYFVCDEDECSEHDLCDECAGVLAVRVATHAQAKSATRVDAQETHPITLVVHFRGSLDDARSATEALTAFARVFDPECTVELCETPTDAEP